MTRSIRELLDACRVPPSVRPGRAGLWQIDRVTLEPIITGIAGGNWLSYLGPYRSLTMLFRDTIATLHSGKGECVMEDSDRELRRHLPILLAGHGRILVSGLGLGCVVRGLLSKSDVEHIDVVEIDPAIIKLAGAEFANNPRVTIHFGDAEEIEWPAETRWDYAWHDVWSEIESLDVVHARLLVRYQERCRVHGAWMFPRQVARRFPGLELLGAPRRRRVA